MVVHRSQQVWGKDSPPTPLSSSSRRERAYLRQVVAMAMHTHRYHTNRPGCSARKHVRVVTVCFPLLSGYDQTNVTIPIVIIKYEQMSLLNYI